MDRIEVSSPAMAPNEAPETGEMPACPRNLRADGRPTFCCKGGLAGCQKAAGLPQERLGMHILAYNRVDDLTLEIYVELAVS